MLRDPERREPEAEQTLAPEAGQCPEPGPGRCCCAGEESPEPAGCPEDTEQSCCHERKKHRSEEEYRNLINRLNRVEGQIRGIRGMVEKSAYCPDILSQVSAATAALNAFSRELLSQHIRDCVAGDIRAGRDETIDELLSTLQKLMK